MVYRQGDVLIIRVKDLPVDAEVIQEGGEIVLAHGEVTGHKHAVRSASTKFLMTPTADQLVNAAQQALRGGLGLGPKEPTQVRGYLEVSEPVEVRHEEHTAIPLDVGLYKVIVQREYVRPAGGPAPGDRPAINWASVAD